MKTVKAIKNGVKPSLCSPMTSWLCPVTSSCRPSAMCCRPPGVSTESRERTSANRRRRIVTTRICIATKLGMGAWEFPGGMCSTCKSASAVPPNNLFRSIVKGSCSMRLEALLWPKTKHAPVLRSLTVSQSIRAANVMLGPTVSTNWFWQTRS